MKVTVLILLVCQSMFCQVGQISGHLNLIGSADFKYITVLIIEKDSVITGSTLTDKGDFKITNLPYGNYKLKVVQIGSREHIQDLLVDKEIIFINIDYPNCPFVEKDKEPKCINDHTDQIIPTVYGLPNKKTMKKAKKGLIHLGGCVMYADCNSFFFCIKHNKEL